MAPGTIPGKRLRVTAKSVTNLFTLLSVLVDSAVKKSWWLKVPVLFLSVGVVGFVQIKHGPESPCNFNP